jgi:hypothetical protein
MVWHEMIEFVDKSHQFLQLVTKSLKLPPSKCVHTEP